jgi:hypothetical protein
MRTAFFIALLALAGCDQLGTAGWDTAILSAQPFELNSQGRTLTSTEQMKALGISSV